MKKATTTQNQSCWERLNYIDNIDSSVEDSLVDTIKDTFFDNTSYRKVYKNETPSVMYDTWIYNGNKPDQIVGFKYLVSYPYSQVQFEVGDMIYWQSVDNNKTYYPWLIISLDTQHYYDVKGRIVACNNILEQYKNGVLEWSYPCVFNDNISGTDLSFGSQGVPQAQGNAIIRVRRNSNTASIKINDRFVLNGGAFQITQINDHIASNYLELYARYVPTSENEVVIQESKNIISPQKHNVVIDGGEQVYYVYNYVNGTRTSDVFDITLDTQGQEIGHLYFEKEDNFFGIECSKKYALPVIITCKNKTNPNTEPVSITLFLGNSW